jgi:hypothetical protein
MRKAACALLLSLSMLGCKEDEKAKPAGIPTSSAASATASATGYQHGDQYDEADLKVPPDYEAEAEQAITDANYKDELARIDRALSGTTAAPAPSASAAAK